MRRALPAIAVLVILALAVVLLDTPFAARRVAAALSTRAELDIVYQEGTLLRGLRLASLHWQREGQEILVRDLQLNPAWSWGCVLRSIVCLEEFRAANIAIEVSPGDEREGSFPPEPLVLPVKFRVAALHIDELSWVEAGQRETLTGVTASVSLGDGILDVQALNVAHRLGALRGDAALEMTGRWPLSVALELKLASGEEALLPDTLPRRWRLHAEGELTDLMLRLNALEQDLFVEASLRLEEGGDGFAVDVTARGLGSLPSVAALRPWVDLAAPVVARYRGTATRGRLQLTSALAGYFDAPAPLEVMVVNDRQGWFLERLALLDASGRERARVSGALGAPGAWAPVLTVVGEEFAPPAAAGVDAKHISGRGTLALSGRETAAAERWSISALDIAAEVSGRSLRLRGSLRDAPDQPLLPLGSLTGSVDDTPWHYRRAMGTEPAALALPRGVSADGFALSSARITVMPGQTTAVELATAGDVESALRLTLREDATGASWTLAPFNAVAAGEVLRSEQPLAGRWSAASREIVVEPFCFRLRSTALCSGRAELGRSGNMTLSLAGEENLSGRLADDPFALRVSGDGDLALRWAEGALLEAELALRLPEVVFDPFVAAGTAEPLRVQGITVHGSATPERQSLALRAGSAPLGELSADLTLDGEALSGDVALAGLSLAALTDLLPELDVKAGTLSGEVQIGGTRLQPELSGELRLRDASATLPGQSIGLRDGSLTVRGAERKIILEGVADLGDGPLRLRGECCDDEALTLTLEGERNRLRAPTGLDVLVSPQLRAVVDSRVAVVRGSVRVHEGLFEHSMPRGEAVALSRDIVRVDREAQKPRRFLVDADVRAIIDPGFTLRSRQLEATLGGDLRVRAPAEQPLQLFGELQVLGGVLRAYGQGLRLDRGSVGFVGDPLNPDINLAAVRDIRAEQLRVGVRATGTLEAAELTLFSEPRRPERETLSYLLRGRAPDVGVAADGTAMALALGASAINESGVFEGLNALPGLSQVSLGADGSEDDTAATISAYVGERLYLSYGMGIYEPVNALTARLYLRSRLWLEVVSRLESSFDLYYRFDRN